MWWRALLALVVAVAMIVGVNYANDYSDGIRGTDDVRAGPVRLVGSRLASPRSVLTAAVLSLALAAAAGLALALASAPWLIAVGGCCIAGAWLYTGGSKPYGYRGLGEVAVFVFFGLVAVLGTQYTQALRVDWVGAVLAVGTGRAVVGGAGGQQSARHPDRLPVRQDHPGGAARRHPHPAAVSGAAGGAAGRDDGAADRDAVVRGGPGCRPAGGAGRPAGARGGAGPALIPVLRDTGLTMLVWAVAVAVALLFG